MYRIQVRDGASHNSAPSAAGVEGAEGLAAVPWAVAGPGWAIHSDPAPLVWRAPEVPEGLAAGPVGGGGAWPGFEARRRTK